MGAAARRWLRRLGGLLLAVLVAAGLYVGTAMALMFWPTADAPAEVPLPAAPTGVAPIEAYVLSNGVHTDLLLPIRTVIVDWSDVFRPADVPAMPADAAFVAIGWGDRDFYLHTQTWADLTASRAFAALRGGNRSLLHVTWLGRAQLQDGAHALPLSSAQYRRLVAHVRRTLPAAHATQIAGAHYGRQDAFYEALGSYNALETCNTWTGRGLREAGVAVSRWTPFDWNVVGHLTPAMP